MSASSDDTVTGLISPPSTPPRKLATPYTIGSCFTAQRHQPPPTGCTDDLPREGTSRDSLKDASQLDWCLSHPPNTAGILTDEYRTIEIERPIRIGDDCGAQVVLLRDGLIAKIYDPLYYNFHYDFGWAPPKNPQKRNVTIIADGDYTAETAAYTELNKAGLVGVITPAYHGSWILNVPVNVEGGSYSRQVYMILLEHVVGTSMLDIDPQELTQSERENIMTKVIEAETDLVIAGVRHTDFEPRNILLSLSASSSSDEESPPDTAPLADPDLRVCIIDFALCAIFPNVEGETAPFKYRNPLFSWSGRDLWSDWGWLPPSEEATEWMWRLWGDGGKDGKYVAVEKDSRNNAVIVKEPVSEAGDGGAPHLEI